MLLRSRAEVIRGCGTRARSPCMRQTRCGCSSYVERIHAFAHTARLDAITVV